MDHVAIMNPKWKLIEKILSRDKTIESRWYKTKRSPWGKIKKGDTIYFKNSGGSIISKAKVAKVRHYILDQDHSKFTSRPKIEQRLVSGSIKHLSPIKIYQKYGKQIGLKKSEFLRSILNKKDNKYCILIWLKDSQQIKPFNIDKTGFGIASAWMVVKDIKKILLNKQR